MRGAISRFLTGVALLGAWSAQAAAQTMTTIEPITLYATRLFPAITGASTTIVTAEEIERSPARTVQEILATVPGVQLRSLYGAVNGTATAVDLRGFGAFSTANTLVLINGRRLNDLDLAGVDLSTLPLQSIERIEVTRGNSVAVLYGDNAVGGVINVVTKSGLGKPTSFRAEAGFGSYGQYEGNVGAMGSLGAFSGSFFANGIASEGYRVNNKLGQANAIGEIVYTGPSFGAFVNLSIDNQTLGFPGTRTVTPPLNINEVVANPRGTSTPFDYGDKQGVNVTTGFNVKLWDGGELIVDGGVRDKRQQSGFFGLDPTDIFSARYVDTTLQTWSFTPRLNIDTPLFGLRSNIRTGIDYYDADYNSERKIFESSFPPSHVYDITQRTVAGYWQHMIGIAPATDISYGGRLERMNVNARDRFNINGLPPFFLGAQTAPLDQSETNHAWHVGIEHRFNEQLALFTRAGRSFRTPNVDERVATSPEFDFVTCFCALPRTFNLKTQTSHDLEAGFRLNSGPLSFQASAYDMHLKNEIHFQPNPALFYNYNLDPTHRYGVEASAAFAVTESFRLTGSAAITRAVFEEGPLKGNDVPLVAQYTGTLGFSWNVWGKYLVVDALARGWADRRYDNDQQNMHPRMPDGFTADIKFSGQVEKMFWSFAVNNIFDTNPYDYAIASDNPARIGWYSAYTLPGRTFVLKAGVQL